MDLKVDFNAQLLSQFFDSVKSSDVKPEPSVIDYAARSLERSGWFESIAGSEDFAAAARAVAKLTLIPRKGLFVWGAFGCGKTSLLRALTKCIQSPYKWVNLGDSEHAQYLDADNYPNWNKEACEGNIILDDLGAEATISDYGVLHEYAGEFIVRYHLRGHDRLFVTTNLSGEELQKRYTMRVCSRLKELTIPLHLKGNDKRRF